MEKFLIASHVLLMPLLNVNGDSFSTIVPLNIELNSTMKSALRYGFQKTSECSSFEKSFLCIQKCLDLNFDVAYADKNCKCTCHAKKDKAKYTSKYSFTRTNWKLGAPTTSIPPWAQDKKKTEKTESDITIESHETEPADVSVTIKPDNSTSDTMKVSTSINTKTKETPASPVQAGTTRGNVKKNQTNRNAAVVLSAHSVSAATGTEAGALATTAVHDGTTASATGVNAATTEAS